MPDTLTMPEVSPSDSRPASGAASTGARPSNFRPPNPAADRVGHAIQARANKSAGLPPPEPLKPLKADAPAPSVGDPNMVDPITKPADEMISSTTGQDEDAAKEATAKEDATKPVEEGKTKDGKPGKVSAWKLVEQYKKTASELKSKTESLEAELTKIRAGSPPEAQTKEISDRATAAEARVKELEDEIRFTRFEKHPEFQEKYAKPYDQAWKRATSELSEVTVTDQSTGAVRAATAEDMLALVNLPLGKAREYADQLFGAFADDAMGHRKEIKSLFESQQAALKEARENGSKREAQMREQSEVHRAALHKELAETWNEANQAVRSDPNVGKFLTPVEGNQKWNETLTKATEFTDRAFANDPRNPNLTPAQRKEAVQMHSAMRNRSIAYGPMRITIKEQEARIGELEKMLEEFSASEPATAGSNGKSSTAPATPANPFDRIASAIKKRAR